jgi:type IV pilus assembly protein PilQ
VTASRGFALILTLIITGAVAEWSGVAAGAAAAPTVQLKTISARAHPGGTSLVVETSEPTAYAASRPDPLTILLDLRNVDGARVSNAVGGSAEGPIAGIAVEAIEALGAPVSRVRVTLARAADYQVRSERNTIVVDLASRTPSSLAAQSATPAAVDPIAALGLNQPGGPGQSASVPIGQPALVDVQAQAQDAVQVPPSATVSIAQAPQAQSQIQSLNGRRGYTGNPISLDFQGADLRSVLRMFSEISGLNIVIDPAVKGTVDVMLSDVPWDQALDIILRANKLGYLLDGTIVRIAPLTTLAEEEGQRRKLTDEQALAGELRVLTKTLSYARAEDMQALVSKSALSARGTVQVDPRTNTVIITDLQERLTTAESLLNTLDRAQPQVEIEARIVQTTRDFAKALGVNWGFNGRADAALGNTTNLAFPNSGALGGRAGGAQGPTGQPSAVDLGVGAATSALGLALGSINGAFNLDVALSALERTGNGKLLSTPRVSTQNNIEAEITQGVQIPIQTVANNTITVSFKDAALTLKVTPQITASGTVIMKIAVENASPDFARAVGENNIPPINTQRANTTVLVADGQTTVIGGIYTSQEQKSLDKTPVLSRLPFLKWLFQREITNDQSTELLIFITPRITKA